MRSTRSFTSTREAVRAADGLGARHQPLPAGRHRGPVVPLRARGLPRARERARPALRATCCSKSPVRPALESGLAGWTFRTLDGDAMRRGRGRRSSATHDFSAFRSAECQALSPVKTLRALAIERRGAYWRFDFDADAFLHHMIRNIIGCLVAVGSGARSPELARRGARAARPRARRRDLRRRRPVFPRPVLRCRPCDSRSNAGDRLAALRRCAPKAASGREPAHADQDLRRLARSGRRRSRRGRRRRDRLRVPSGRARATSPRQRAAALARACCRRS